MRKSKKFMGKIKEWTFQNAIAIGLVLVFIFIYMASQHRENVFLYFGATGMSNLHGEYYRWFTCLFLHYNLRHLLSNSLALLSVSSLISPFLRKRQILFLFLSGGILSEAAFSIVISDPVYDIGASSGIFTLIACLILCYLRFQQQFSPRQHRAEILLILIYFIFANSSVSAFLVHTFGFAAGILISFAMVLTDRIKKF